MRGRGVGRVEYSERKGSEKSGVQCEEGELVT